MNLVTIPAFAAPGIFHVVLALPVEARREARWKTFADLGERVWDECILFTRAAAALEGKQVEVLGWGSPEEALALITSGA
jgi:inorganic pyrophosphatase